jgi:hypothetical protein
MGGVIMHTNAWPLIEKYLKRQKKRQGDLAELLGVSHAAISLFKSERILFNPRQIEKIINYLCMSTADRDEVYSMLFSARLLPLTNDRLARNKTEWEDRLLPLGSLGILRDYDPAFGPMDQYFANRATKRMRLSCDRPGLCLLILKRFRKDQTLLDIPVILIDTLAEAGPEDLALVMSADHMPFIRNSSGRRRGVILNFNEIPYEMEKLISKKSVLWAKPIVALNIPLTF